MTKRQLPNYAQLALLLTFLSACQSEKAVPEPQPVGAGIPKSPEVPDHDPQTQSPMPPRRPPVVTVPSKQQPKVGEPLRNVAMIQIDQPVNLKVERNVLVVSLENDGVHIALNLLRSGITAIPAKVSMGPVGSLVALSKATWSLNSNGIVIEILKAHLKYGENRIRLEFENDAPVEYGLFVRRAP